MLSTSTELAIRATDPVIEQKKKKLALIEELAVRFKRIDIEFLQMAKDNFPVFALQTWENYLAGVGCSFTNTSGYAIGNTWAFRELFVKQALTSGTSAPKATPPATVKAIVEPLRPQLDEVYVAWEADWVPAAAGDPLVIGELDGLYFLIAQWDTTKLESYIAATLTS